MGRCWYTGHYSWWFTMYDVPCEIVGERLEANYCDIIMYQCAMWSLESTNCVPGGTHCDDLSLWDIVDRRCTIPCSAWPFGMVKHPTTQAGNAYITSLLRLIQNDNQSVELQNVGTISSSTVSAATLQYKINQKHLKISKSYIQSYNCRIIGSEWTGWLILM